MLTNLTYGTTIKSLLGIPLLGAFLRCKLLLRFYTVNQCNQPDVVDQNDELREVTNDV